MSPLSRRGLLLGAATVGLAGCGGAGAGGPVGSGSGSAGSGSGATGQPSPATSTASTVALAPSGPVTLLPGEPVPAAKQAAMTVLRTALTTDDGAADLAGRLGQAAEPAVARDLAPLLAGVGASAVDLGYAQFGGLTPKTPAAATASVMAVLTQRYVPTGAAAARSREVAVDVRLSRRGGRWVATRAMVGPTRPPAASVPAAVTALLASTRVDLPAPARADLRSGLVDERLARLLLDLSRDFRLSVQVLASGHPREVFGTDRDSNHTHGRAVDIHAIDGIPVVDRSRAPWRQVMTAAASLGATEIGGPVDLDGVRGKRPYFSDLLHQDHLHLGFEANPADPVKG